MGGSSENGYIHQYDLVWNPHFAGTRRGIHVQHWYQGNERDEVEGGFCLCGIDGVNLWTAEECRIARAGGVDPSGAKIERNDVPEIAAHPSPTVLPTCPECLADWLRRLERADTSLELPAWWVRNRPQARAGRVRYSLVWNPVAFDGFSPGKVHVQVWTRFGRKWVKEQLLDGRDGSGFLSAERCHDIPDAPNIPEAPSSVDLPTCNHCRVRWLRILENDGIEVPEELSSWSEPTRSPFTGERHEAFVRAHATPRLLPFE